MRLIGTAGHVDHGKSTLVRALTGIDPMRLAEERERGMTLQLGYAHLDHPDGWRLGVVDVPGHERLVRTMVAGATGFRLALWVVDAGEGVMPQSVEHLRILELLGVRALVPVVTRADLAEAERTAATCAAVDALLATAAVRALPRHVVDSVSGRGIDALRGALLDACRGDETGDADAPAYLPIDRAFTLRGAGTVVTGTLARGRLAEGDRVALASLPGTWRVRALHQHHARVDSVGPGERVAVNLAGVDADALSRGDTLTAPDYPYAARRMNVRLHPLADARTEWKHGMRLRIHAGCWEAECRVWGAERDGDAWWAQVEIPAARPFFAGQRFILRATAPRATVGGGEVLDLAPARPRRVAPAEREAYAARGRGEPWLGPWMRSTESTAVPLPALARRWMLPARVLLADAEADPSLRTAPSVIWRAEWEDAVLDGLRALVDAHPAGERHLPFERLGAELGVDPAHLPALLAAWLADAHPAAAWLRARVRVGAAGIVLRPGEDAASPEARALAATLLARLRADGLRPPAVRHLRAEQAAPPRRTDAALAWLAARGAVVRVSGDLVLAREAADALHASVAALDPAGLRAGDIGRALGLSRKYAIPYLEYLGRQGLLRRDGDLHFPVAKPA
jgi:selenocysteine-specific elongation factor